MLRTLFARGKYTNENARLRLNNERLKADVNTGFLHNIEAYGESV
jgi:hypothetical protein